MKDWRKMSKQTIRNFIIDYYSKIAEIYLDTISEKKLDEDAMYYYQGAFKTLEVLIDNLKLEEELTNGKTRTKQVSKSSCKTIQRVDR